jgi:hypothetical protein
VGCLCRRATFRSYSLVIMRSDQGVRLIGKSRVNSTASDSGTPSEPQNTPASSSTVVGGERRTGTELGSADRPVEASQNEHACPATETVPEVRYRVAATPPSADVGTVPGRQEDYVQHTIAH